MVKGINSMDEIHGWYCTCSDCNNRYDEESQE